MSAKKQILQEEAITEISQDRRRKRRYPISLSVEFKIVKNYLVTGCGAGTSIDLSSNGIAIATDQQLRVGSYVELSANWPVLLDGSCPLKLMIFGKVVRSDGRITAIATDRHEFRTRKAGSMAGVAPAVSVAACLR